MDVQEKIIPFFNNYSILGVKSKDLEDFNSVAFIMKEKGHLTSVLPSSSYEVRKEGSQH